AHMRLDSSTHIVMQALWFLKNASSSTHVLEAMMQTAGVCAFLAFFTSLLCRLVRRRWLALPLGLLLSIPLLSGPFLTLGAVQPYHWKVVLLLFDYLILAWVLLSFDALTMGWTLFAFIFCWENYHLAVMLTPGGVLEPWIAFAV